MALEEYERKRNFGRTPEPRTTRLSKKRKRRHEKELRFVIQKHDATRLHYDFRLETKNGVLKSWAVPKGLSLDPSERRLAIMTEDHPGDYIDFEGEIPEGNYGAGSVIVWDTGIYKTEKDIEEQISKGKIAVTLYGEKVKGSFALIRTRREYNQWLVIKHKDEFASTEDILQTMPHSALSGKTITPKRHTAGDRIRDSIVGIAKPFPSSVKPMLATPVDEPFDKDGRVFEVKWDGVRALVFRNKSDNVSRIQSRKGNEISHRYPELISAIHSQVRCNNSVVLDGEIVVLNEYGVPDFQRHQRRMNIDDRREIGHLSSKLPATYYVFDILYLDGMNLEQLDLAQRRGILSRVVKPENRDGRIRISEFIEGKGKEVFENAIALRLEGIIAKYIHSKYQQGSRSAAWLKIKGVLTQDCVVIGYTRGEGNRAGYFGSLILAVNVNHKLRFVGHTGSGFGSAQLEEALRVMQRLVVDKCPIDSVPYVNRKPVWLRPELVVEVKFHGWTAQRIMRAPIFVRFRDDKRPEECIIETPKDTSKVLNRVAAPAYKTTGSGDSEKTTTLTFSNLQKVYWPPSPLTHNRPLTKQDLLDYYESVSRYLLPHLENRPLSLSRYPDGINGKSFYHKNWDQSKPDFVKTIQVFSESSQRVVNYLLCNNKESLLWIANLGCIEMHPWYSRVHDFTGCRKVAEDSRKQGESILEESKCGLNIPDFIVFDLDPYIYSGRETSSGEPEYNVKGFKAAVEVAFLLKDFLDSLGVKSYVKTSGKTGLHIFVPVAPNYTYDQTRTFAELVGKILMTRSGRKVTMDWSTQKRRGKVFLDYNQNAMGKTVASVLSARPTASATVSMPLDWKKLDQVLPTDFTMLNVPQILRRIGDPWRDILDKQQDLATLLQGVTEIA